MREINFNKDLGPLSGITTMPQNFQKLALTPHITVIPYFTYTPIILKSINLIYSFMITTIIITIMVVIIIIFKQMI